MDTNSNKGGWLASTKTFLSGVAKEVGALYAPLPDQSLQNSAANVTSPLGGHSYQQQQQQQQQGGYGQPQAQYGAQYGGGQPQQYGQPSYGQPAPASYGGYDNGSQDIGDGVLPVVPLAQQYSSSRPGSRRASLDPNLAGTMLPQQQHPAAPTINPALGSFPTSHFPTSPPNALSQQLQPLGHPNYAASAHQSTQPQQQYAAPPGTTQYSLSELEAVKAVSASPSPSPPPVVTTGMGFGAPASLAATGFQPVMPNSSGPVNPAHLSPRMPNSSSLQPAMPPQTYGSAPISAPSMPSAVPHQFNPAAAIVAPPARRILDEGSMNPSLPPSSGYSAAPPPGQPAPPSSYGYNPSGPQLASPGRVLSPAFSTGGSNVPAGGAVFSRPAMPGAQPIDQSLQPQPSAYAAQPASVSPRVGMGAPGVQQPQHLVSPSNAGPIQYGNNGVGIGMSSSGMPPPPPVSSYWKARAAVAPVTEQPADPHVGRVDYSDIDYKSMDFAYNNRYERPPQVQNVPPPQAMQQQQTQQYQQPPQLQQQPPYGMQPPYGQQPQQQQQQSYGAPPPSGYSGYGR